MEYKGMSREDFDKLFVERVGDETRPKKPYDPYIQGAAYVRHCVREIGFSRGGGLSFTARVQGALRLWRIHPFRDQAVFIYPKSIEQAELLVNSLSYYDDDTGYEQTAEITGLETWDGREWADWKSPRGETLLEYLNRRLDDVAKSCPEGHSDAEAPV